MDAKKNGTKHAEPRRSDLATAVAFVNNEIVLGCLKRVLAEIGYQTRHEVDAAPKAKIAVVGAYFAHLGIIRQLRAANPSLPVLIIETVDYPLNGFLASVDEIYDVLRIGRPMGSDVERRLREWFSDSRGRSLTQAGPANGKRSKRRE